MNVIHKTALTHGFKHKMQPHFVLFINSLLHTIIITIIFLHFEWCLRG